MSVQYVAHASQKLTWPTVYCCASRFHGRGQRDRSGRGYGRDGCAIRSHCESRGGWQCLCSGASAERGKRQPRNKRGDTPAVKADRHKWLPFEPNSLLDCKDCNQLKCTLPKYV